jgi:hypothetical protein
MIAATPKNFQGKLDEARPRCGGDVASIIRSSTLEIGQYTARVVLTESRRTILGGSMPVCWAIITRLYELDADGPEVLVDRESVWTDAAVLDGAYDDALRESALLVKGALTSEEVRL